MARIDELFEVMLREEASDLHIAESDPPKMRAHGHLLPIPGYPVLDRKTAESYMREICEERWEEFLQSWDLDFAYSLGDRARFRCNYLFQTHGLGAVFRLIPTRIKSVEDLGVPTVLKSFASLRSGLVLITGPTGSGKSTTLAAIIDLINSTSARHILTIEEPIEFVHPPKKSLICQREVGIDVPSFAEGLRAAVRQDCDVVLVGEMRDYETISLAISAASMGSLVFGTLHTLSAVKTVDRIIDAFPFQKQNQVRSMLADSLRGVSAQILIRTTDGKGRVAATEILLASTALSNSVREANTQNIRNIIQSGRSQGMQLMDDSILKLLKDERITAHDAYMNAVEKGRFAHLLDKDEVPPTAPVAEPS